MASNITTIARSSSSLTRIGRPSVIVSLLAAGTLGLVACTTPAGVKQTEKSLEAAEVPSVERSILDLADRMASEGKFATAIPLYRRAHQMDGDAIEPLVGLGEALLATGRNQDAIGVFRIALDDHSENVAVLTGMGRASLAMGRPAEALPFFDRALDARPGNSEALNGKGVALAAMGDADGAITTFRQGLDRAPEHMALKNNLGLALTLAGESSAGIDLLEEVVEEPSATARNRQTLALAYGVAGRADDARQMAAIDLDLVDVEANLAEYRTLAARSPNERAAMVLGNAGESKQDPAKPANRHFLEPVEAAQTVRRLLREPAPVEAAAIEPEPTVEPEPEEPMDIPPLDDRVGYAVQIAAYRTAEQLMPGWEKLKAKYGELLEGLDPRRSEVDFGDRKNPPRGSFYRLNAGPLQTFSEARTICDAIITRGGECWIRPPLPSEGRPPESEPGKPAEVSANTPAPQPDSGDVLTPVKVRDPAWTAMAQPTVLRGHEPEAESAQVEANTETEVGDAETSQAVARSE